MEGLVERSRCTRSGLLLAAIVLAVPFSVAAASPAPAPVPRLLAVLADADNRTVDPAQGDLSDRLRLALEPSPRLAVAGRAHMVNLLREGGRPAPAAIGEAEARTAAARMDAALLLLVSASRTPSGVELSMKEVDLRRGGRAFEASATVPSVEGLPVALLELSRRIRLHLGEDRQEVDGTTLAPAAVAPVPREVVRLREEAQAFRTEGRMGQRRAALLRALAVDPGNPVLNLERYAEEGDPRYLAAMAGDAARLSPRERAILDALLRESRGGTRSELLRDLDRIIARWPENPFACQWAGKVHLEDRADVASARPYLERTLLLADLPEDQVADLLAALGRFDEAAARARPWAEGSTQMYGFYNLSLILLSRGDTAGALDAARRAWALRGGDPIRKYGPPGGLIWPVPFLEADAAQEFVDDLAKVGGTSVQWLEYQGRYQEALAELTAPAQRAERARVLARRGKDPEAVGREVGLLSASGGGGACLPAILLEAGLVAEAVPLLDGTPEPDRDACRRLSDALLLWRRGDREGALRALATIAGNGSAYQQARILLELGRDREAADRFRQYRREGMAFDSGVPAWYPRSLFLEASARDRLGEREEARRLVDRLLRLWVKADADTPYLPEARELAARLAR
jgi:tetratricopeptide (TPR) repeat protein